MGSSRAALLLSLTLVACATTASTASIGARPPGTPAPSHAGPAPGEPGEPAATPPPPPASAAGFAVQAAVPPGNEITVTGNSDLPAGMPSAAQPFGNIIEAAVRPLRPALAECLRPVGPAGRRSVRVTVERGGEIVPRPPQPYPVSERVGRCITGVLRAGTVDPPPPMDLPWDIAVEVSP